MRHEEEFHSQWHGREVVVMSGPFEGQHGVAQYGDSSLNTVAVAFSGTRPIVWLNANALRIVGGAPYPCLHCPVRQR